MKPSYCLLASLTVPDCMQFSWVVSGPRNRFAACEQTLLLVKLTVHINICQLLLFKSSALLQCADCRCKMWIRRRLTGQRWWRPRNGRRSTMKPSWEKTTLKWTPSWSHHALTMARSESGFQHWYKTTLALDLGLNISDLTNSTVTGLLNLSDWFVL